IGLYALRLQPLAALLLGGAVVLAGRLIKLRQGAGAWFAPLLPLTARFSVAAAAALAPFSLWTLFLVFLKTGAVLYGSGYVLLAFLQADLVHNLGWMTQQQLLDA